MAHVHLLLEGLHQFFEKTAKSSGGGYIFAVDRNTRILSFPHDSEFDTIEELSQLEPRFLPIAGQLNLVNEDLKARTAGFPKAATIASGIREMNLEQDEGDLLLASLVDPLKGIGGTSSQAVQFPFLDCPITGEPATATIFHVPKTYWKIIIVTPDSLALAAADEITKQVTIMIIALELALLGIMFLVFRRTVTTPVHQMSEQVEAMALSDGHEFEPLDEFRSDELGNLAYQFNRRQAQLAKTFRDLADVKASLETRVQERTAELSKANEELGRTARMKDEFLAGMSHELRTPLNAILGLSEAMKEGIYGPLNERQVKSLGSIEDGGRHLLALINDILDVAKIEAGELQLETGRVAIQRVSESSVGFVKQQAAKKDIELTCHYHLIDAYFEADERRVKQILVNLLNNAVKFTPNGGKVGLTVHQHAEEGTVTFSVSDTGIGIAEEDIEKLYKPFVQLDSRLNREHNGTGLGLSLVFHLVQMHGGQISVTSELHRGSCFTVTLPLKLVEDS
ncbi:MAG: ATP-binding protein, partial [Verrucomicrobiota bacterium]